MVDFTKHYYVNGYALEVREAINFDQFKLDPALITNQERDQLLRIPQLDSGCVVRTHPTKSGSAFSQMEEPAILAGLIRADEGIKALVVFTERPVKTRYDFGFVSLNQIRKVNGPSKKDNK